jgi:GrpB-like predicted nucleotidyltransferase (UPF0157 family)
VPGLAAKPLIDMMVAVNLSDRGRCVGALGEIGYRRDESGDFEGRVFLLRLDERGVPTHHLSLAELDGPYWRDQIAFREALRADPVLCNRYASLKKTLAARHGRSVAYTHAKTDFVRDALASVGHRPERGWRASRAARTERCRGGIR